MCANSNTASRLIELLKKLKTGDPDRTLLEIWRNIFDLETTNGIKILKRLVFVNEMLDDTERKIKLVPNLNYEIYLSCIPQIREVLSPIYFNHSRQSIVAPNITQDVIARLEFCSEALK